MERLLFDASAFFHGFCFFLSCLSSSSLPFYDICFILSAYAPVRDAIGAGAPNSPWYMKFLAGAITGAIGSIAG
jgi:hypothetical protein